ncbi:MAG: PASTA domain-containing protein [Synergistaceae bacterium]|nr:PASTA domain-containing protein [Synergistaceae bacterium]
MGKIFRWTLLFVVLVIFASGSVAFYTVFFSTSDEITMPLLRNMSLLEAENEAKRLGFVVRAESVVSSLPQWQVVAQSPEAGVKVRSDRTILLKVSRGGIRRSIPDVRRLTASEAQNVLQEQGFNIGNIVYIQDDSRPGGTVIAQSPSSPANIPSDKKVDLLISQGGAGADGRVVVPDTAGMTERRARELLTASGFRIAVVDSVFSPNDTEGHVIGTRPSGGTMARAGDGIRLRVATTRRPDGVPERPVQAQTPANEPSSQVVVTVPGQGNVLIGVDPARPTSEVQAVNTNISVFDQQSRPVSPQPEPQQPVPPPAAQAPPAGTQQANLEPVGGKIAKIRYQVPPLARPLQLKIELVDPTGTKVLLDRDARSGEYVSLDAPYSRECVVSIYLGGQFVWQDRYM